MNGLARPAAAGLAALIVSAAAGCGRAAPAPPPVTYTVVIDAVRYQPDVLTAHVGDTIVWQNDDPFPHTVTAASGEPASPDIAADASWRWTAGTAGDVHYACKYHPTMTGTIQVR